MFDYYDDPLYQYPFERTGPMPAPSPPPIMQSAPPPPPPIMQPAPPPIMQSAPPPQWIKPWPKPYLFPPDWPGPPIHPHLKWPPQWWWIFK